MSETTGQEQTIAEQRIMGMNVPMRYLQEAPRVCLLQIRKLETFSEETEEQRRALEEYLYWDHEDYDEEDQGIRPKGADPQADVLVCGVGGCTLRIFQAEDGSDIQTGECKAANFCLRDKFKEVGQAPTVEEGRGIYREIIDTCDGFRGGNFCPRLNCSLSAGVSEDQVPGTAGVCELEGQLPLEGLDR